MHIQESFLFLSVLGVGLSKLHTYHTISLVTYNCMGDYLN